MPTHQSLRPKKTDGKEPRVSRAQKKKAAHAAQEDGSDPASATSIQVDCATLEGRRRSQPKSDDL